jgi:hypothetical protein
MYALFEASNTEGDVVDFIRQTYSSGHGLTRGKELFTAIKKEITGKQNAVEFSEDLRRHAALYQALLNPAHPHWKQFSPPTAGHVGTLNFLGLTRIRPLLLAILQKFPSEDVETALRRAVSWGVRLTVIGSLGSGSVEESFCQRAKEINDGAIGDADSLSKAIETIIPTDTVFEEAFKVLIVTKNKLARYLLQALERKSSGDTEPELVVNTDPTELNLEHVLPQNLGTNWPGIAPEVAAANAYRLGNMVLLRKSENESLGNDGFAKKKPILLASSLVLTKRVGQSADWGPAEIKRRQDELAKLAIAVWPLR